MELNSDDIKSSGVPLWIKLHPFTCPATCFDKTLPTKQLTDYKIFKFLHGFLPLDFFLALGLAFSDSSFSDSSFSDSSLN